LRGGVFSGSVGLVTDRLQPLLRFGHLFFELRVALSGFDVAGQRLAGGSGSRPWFGGWHDAILGRVRLALVRPVRVVRPHRDDDPLPVARQGVDEPEDSGEA
jgi:hypothetical protein